MGRHLLRRTILIFAAFSFSILADEISLPVRRGVSVQLEIPETTEEIRQGHNVEQYPVLLNHPSLIPYIIDELDKLKTEGSRKAFMNSLKRSMIFRADISRILKEKGLPPEILFLPLVESAYQINARSRSDAVGLWQFKDNSTEEFGLEIDEWVDERKDFIKSTYAAADKLQHNYEKTGDWLLAIAAYNCGLGAMNRAIKKTGTRDYWELCRLKALPSQTRDYIPRLLAINWIIHSKKEAGLDIIWPEPVKWTRLLISGPSISLEILAEKTHADPELLKLGNAALITGLTPPEIPYELKIPAASARDTIVFLNESGIFISRMENKETNKNHQSSNSLIYSGMLSLTQSVQENSP